MKTRLVKVLVALIVLGFLGSIALAFSSFTATKCTARVLGGQGTVNDPLRIEVDGNAGLLPFLDSLLPFRGIPSIELSYVGERFSIPGLNDFFGTKTTLTTIIYLATIFLLIIAVGWVILLMLGKRILIVDA